MKKLILSFVLLSSFSIALFSQTYNNPIAGKQSHPELVITQIEISSTNTIVSLEVTNKLEKGGWFCADKSIYLQNSNGAEKYKLIKSENIPTCPEQYEFSFYGEKLKFKLFFLPISKNIKYLDLVEDCSNACFSFHGIILDNAHNENIRNFEQAFDFYQKKQLLEAISYFEKVVGDNFSVDSQIYGLSYYYLIEINHELNNHKKVKFWLEELNKADISDKKTYYKEIEKLGIE